MKIKKGFTLLELTIVVALVSISLPVFFNLVFNLMRQQSNIASLQRVKADGDFVRQSIINATQGKGYTIDETCATVPGMPATKICFEDFEGNQFGYGFTGAPDYKISSYSAALGEIELTAGTSGIIPTRITSAVFEKRNEKTVRFNFVVEHVPSVDYLASPELTYDFFVMTQR